MTNPIQTGDPVLSADQVRHYLSGVFKDNAGIMRQGAKASEVIFMTAAKAVQTPATLPDGPATHIDADKLEPKAAKALRTLIHDFPDAAKAAIGYNPGENRGAYGVINGQARILLRREVEHHGLQDDVRVLRHSKPQAPSAALDVRHPEGGLTHEDLGRFAPNARTGSTPSSEQQQK